jgi:hypothetical protein
MKLIHRPHPTKLRKNRREGAVLPLVLVVSFLAALVVSGGVVMAGSSFANVRSREDSEASLLLAEGGVNAELRKVTAALETFSGSNNWDNPSSKGSGTIAGVPGSYTVFVSADAAGTQTWNGSGIFYVTCTATTPGAAPGGTIRTVTTQANASSLFNGYGMFGTNTSSNGGPNSMTFSNNAQVNIGGVAGTNGHTSCDNSCSVSYVCGYNCGSNGNLCTGTCNNGNGWGWNGGNSGSGNAPIYSCGQTRCVPTIPQVIRSCSSFSGSCGNMDDDSTWNYLKNNQPSCEKSTICTWSGSNHTLCQSSCTQAYSNHTPSTTCDHNLWTNADQCNVNPNTGKKCLILQPGDYYFSNLQLQQADQNNYELIIDNAGQTCGGNPNGNQVRIWVCNSAGNSNDTFNIPCTLTNSNDPSTFRIYYGTNNGTLTSCATSYSWWNQWWGNFNGNPVTGCLYAHAATSSHPTATCCCDFSNGCTTYTGSLVCDQVKCSSGCLSVNYQAPASKCDPCGSVGCTGGYYSCH